MDALILSNYMQKLSEFQRHFEVVFTEFGDELGGKCVCAEEEKGF